MTEFAARIGGCGIVEARIVEQATGNWYADIGFQSETDLSGGVDVFIEGTTWRGTVLRCGDDFGMRRARIVGGAGGLVTAVPAKHYVSSSLSSILSDLLAACGETLSSTSATTTLAARPSTWERQAGLASAALQEICDAAGLEWRVLRDGTLWLGALTWAATTAKPEELESDGGKGIATLANALDLQPGTTWRGNRVGQVTHFLDAGAIRTEIAARGMRDIWGALTAQLTRAARYAAVWPSKVTAQGASGVIQCLPDNALIGGSGLDNLSVLLGLPGFEVSVPSGCRGVIGFAEGSPQKGRWVGWEAGSSVTSITFDGGTKAVARVDDALQCGELLAQLVPSGPAVGCVMAVWWRPDATASWTQIASLPIPPTPATPGTPITGKITSGCTKLLA